MYVNTCEAKIAIEYSINLFIERLNPLDVIACLFNLAYLNPVIKSNSKKINKPIINIFIASICLHNSVASPTPVKSKMCFI